MKYSLGEKIVRLFHITLPFSGILLGAALLSAQPRIPTPQEMSVEYDNSIKLLLNNLNHPGISDGAVIASPSTNAPDYFYHWTRDAAVTHESLFEVYNSTPDQHLKNQIKDLAKSWIGFESRAQINTEGQSGGLAEPLFFLNGFVNTKPWGRPQVDGPATRALTMTLWANQFLSEGDANYVANNLYRGELPSTSPIKKDLEFVAHNWKLSSFDLWEETKGLHFYTLSMERKALLAGADLADKLNDGGAAGFYRQQADLIKTELGRFSNAGKPYIVVTLDQDAGWGHKESGLDIAVTLAANHALFNDDFFLSQKDLFTHTLETLEGRFHDIYEINSDNSLANALGRYPEDVYDGVAFTGANPWFIATHASAEYYCKLAKIEKSPTEAKRLRDKGLSYFARSLKHRDQETGEMTEQYSRHNGFLVGARHLTWSYASYITAYQACN